MHNESYVDLHDAKFKAKQACMTGRQAGQQTGREADRQRGMQAGRQAERQTGRQAEAERQWQRGIGREA